MSAHVTGIRKPISGKSARTGCHVRNQPLLDSFWWTQGPCASPSGGLWLLHHCGLSVVTMASLAPTCLLRFQLLLSQFSGLFSCHSHSNSDVGPPNFLRPRHIRLSHQPIVQTAGVRRASDDLCLAGAVVVPEGV